MKEPEISVEQTMTDESELKRLTDALKEQSKAMYALLECIDNQADENDFRKRLNAERSRIEYLLATTEPLLNNLQTVIYQEVEKRGRHYRNLIDKLKRSVESVNSENYLLEYKRRDLLQLTSELEEAYEKISERNKELQLQKQLISEQAEELKVAQEKLMQANEALELQKESLLDQSDYLHEANRSIMQMHEEVQQQKEEIEHKNEELQALNAEKNNLIGIVAHDLKSPLNQIKGLLALVKMTNANRLDADTLNMISMMEGSVGNMTSMILKILDTEAIESKQLNLTIEKVHLSELLNATANRFATEAANKGITLILSIGFDIYAMVDRGYTDQVFQNLISNAIKFSPADKNVTVSLKAKDGFALIEIKDEGPGLTDEDKKKLFGKYQKLSAKPTGDESSTGLGLSIVKKFIDTMKGEIGCVSEVDKGACFFVKFALAT